jgi:alanine-alpha-ketoisovalerate/valine-pyruvate aminotransferase
MTKFSSGLLVAFLLLSFTATAQFSLTIGSASNVQSGQQVCLNVTAANFTNIVGMQFSINYNPAMLQLTSVSNFGLPGLTAGGSFGLPIAGGAGTTSAGAVTMTWTDPDQSGETLANGATLFTLCFNALASTGSTQVTFSGTPTSIEVINTALQTVPFNSVPGTVTFGSGGGGTPTPIALTVGSQSNVMSGTQVCLNVTVQNFTNINAFQTTLTYSSTMLQSATVSNFGVAGMTAANFNTSTPGTIVVNWTNATAQTVASGGVLFRVCFTANASSGSTQVTAGSSTATNASSQSVPVNNTAGTVSFSSGNNPTGFTLTMGSATNVQSGQQVCLNVTAANFTNIVGMQFSINYNPAMLQLTSVSNFGLPGLTAGGSFGLPIAGGAGSTSAGTVTMTWTDPDQGGETVANGATLFTLCFNALASTGSTPVTFTGTPTSIEVINTALQNVPFNSVPGTVSFTGGGGGNPTGFTLTMGSASNVQSGQQVCLDVTAANFTNIVGMQFSINYNPAMLQLTSVSNFGLPGLTAGGSFGLPIAGGAGSTSAGTVTMTWTDPDQSGETVANGATLFTLCFNALANTGSTQVSFSSTPTSIEVINASLQNVPFNSVPGTVSFTGGGGGNPTGFTLTMGSATNVQSGQQVCLDVTAANFTNIVGMQFSISYNPAMLQLTSVANFGLPGLTAGGSFGLPIAGGAGSTSAGTITMTWTDPDQGGETVANGATLFTLCFNALASTGSTQVTFTGTPTSIEVINTALQNVPFNSVPGTVTFGNSGPSPIALTVGSQSNVMSGAQVCLDVTVQNFTNINAFQTTLTYNSTMLQSVAVSNFGVAGMTAANFNTSTPGTIVVNWTNATAQTVASGGVLVPVVLYRQREQRLHPGDSGNEHRNQRKQPVGDGEQYAGYGELYEQQPDGLHPDDGQRKQCPKRPAGLPERNGGEFHEYSRDAIQHQLQPSDAATDFGEQLRIAGPDGRRQFWFADSRRRRHALQRERSP